ncbi:Small basic protein [Paramaledivibacter caminithermalis DSM 15212]|uniref:Small basic protein n=1 Tax=Paramaledivibacter caminithermalis (strain DSM 15212 / CIP 107654 / DViRD3) TaxID=1121301 RepID=A0A1M6S184_PARC5|nr:Small basic protein [Paramaledivibacter caminithermalis DSM 15212]
MIIGIFGIIIGLIIGFYVPIIFPMIYSSYTSVALLAAIDSVFGAIRASLENKFNSTIFVTGFIGNAIIAGLLAYIGDRMGVPLYYAAIFTFGSRLFQNFAIIRRMLIKKFSNS